MKLRDLFSDDAAIEPQAEAVDVKGLSVDSRAVKPGDLFFAVAGSKTDGSRFVDSAIQAGAVAVAGDHAPSGGARVPFVVTPNPRRALALAAARFYPRQPATISGGDRDQRQDVGRRVHAPDLGTARRCFRQHRHHRAGFAEAHGLRLADDAGSDRASQAARRNHRRRRHASGLRSVLARARPVQARRRAHRRRRFHQSLARPHGLPSGRGALPCRQDAAVPRSRYTWWRGGDFGRS